MTIVSLAVVLVWTLKRKAWMKRMTLLLTARIGDESAAEIRVVLSAELAADRNSELRLEIRPESVTQPLVPMLMLRLHHLSRILLLLLVRPEKEKQRAERQAALLAMVPERQRNDATVVADLEDKENYLMRVVPFDKACFVTTKEQMQLALARR